MARIGQRLLYVGPRKMVQPRASWSVLDLLRWKAKWLHLCHLTSDMVAWSRGSKEDLRETANSLTRRKPKKASSRAARSMLRSWRQPARAWDSW